MRLATFLSSLALLAMSAVAWGHYTNTSPDSVHACVSKTTKVARIVGAGAAAVCTSNERVMHWAVSGSGFRGDWNQSASYKPGDIVLLRGFTDLGNTVGCVFLAMTESTGSNPLENSSAESLQAQWRLLAPEECSREAPVNYDLATAISPSANPSGPWSLGWVPSLSSDINLYSVSDLYPDGFAWGVEGVQTQMGHYGAVFKSTAAAQTTLGPTVNLSGGGLVWFPVTQSPPRATAIRFTAFTSGAHEFNVTWGGGNGNTCRGGPNVLGYVRHNLNLVKEINLQPYNVNAMSAFTDTLMLNGGDTVDFLLVNPQGYDGNCNWTGLFARVSRL